MLVSTKSKGGHKFFLSEQNLKFIKNCGNDRKEMRLIKLATIILSMFRKETIIIKYTPLGYIE